MKKVVKKSTMLANVSVLTGLSIKTLTKYFKLNNCSGNKLKVEQL